MMNPKFEPSTIEAAVQAAWSAKDVYRVTEDASKKKFYACSMLPYPSGKLHMGHVRNYAINDVMLRYLRMRGYNVLMPMGWDAFGLPAENAAIDRKVAPAEWTYANIEDMKSQMQPLGLAFDWSREVATCKPDYYKWNQWFFLKMLEKGVAYRKTQVVNWDPVDQTVLANEQVIDGRGWRSGAIVEKREIPGYYLAITQYADELLSAVTDEADPNYLKGWPDQVRVMQSNWIGKSEGVRFAFPHIIKDSHGKLIGDGRMYVFTTRADTIMGVTFCAVAPEHPIAEHAAKSNAQLAAFIEECKKGGTTEAELALKEKEGMRTGLFVTHPLTGESVEVWVGNYVLMTYGDGAVMGVPAHDERDFAFAKKYNLPIKQVVGAEGKQYAIAAWEDWYADKQSGKCINSGKYDGLTYKQAVDAVAADLAAKGLGEKKTTWRLRDWGISRQRYWGTPIPIIHCPEHGAVPVPEKDLPVILPEDCIPDGSGNPLNKREDFLACKCPICGKDSRRETDTMDTFVDSAWYYMRYTCPDATTMVDARNDYWMPMDQYIGGIEHAVLHLLYARFWTKVMRDMGLVKFGEPFTKLFTQGMLTHDCYYREDESGKKRWFYPGEIHLEFDDKGRPIKASAKEDGLPVIFGGTEKMSKSKNNVVEPREFIAKYGADTARTFVLFAGPPDQSAAWSDSGAEGAYRFLRRLWDTSVDQSETIQKTLSNQNPKVVAPDTVQAESLRNLRRSMHLLLKQASFDFERLQYNTVVSAAMKMLKVIEERPAAVGSSGPNGTHIEPMHEHRAVLAESFSILIRVLYPIAPHISTQLWGDLGYEKAHGPLLDAPWPQVDAGALEQSEITLVVQVNGKLRGEIVVPKGAAREAIESAALANENVVKFTDGKTVKKIVIVPGKLVSVVVA
jgi:leucyl-tRNA synthetase